MGAKPLCFLRLPAVMERTGLGRSKLYAMAREGRFPKPITIDGIAVWPSNEIDEWQRKILAEAGRDLPIEDVIG